MRTTDKEPSRFKCSCCKLVFSRGQDGALQNAVLTMYEGRYFDKKVTELSRYRYLCCRCRTSFENEDDHDMKDDIEYRVFGANIY